MGRNIIILSDGTGNGAAKQNGTNVWRLYQSLDMHSHEQIAFYDDGVGSQEFLPIKLLGGAFGFGLKRNVKELYKFLCRNYQKDDKIYLFGFSRGAFTVRMLAGMIVGSGLYVDFKDEDDLDKKVNNNYYLLRTKYRQTFFSRFFCKGKGITPYKEGHKFPDIEFIGVWDTVDAYGFPIDWMADIWDKTVFPIRFPDQRLSPKVKRACHALSIDDERHTFHPVLWDESKEDLSQKPSRIEQVWFAGAHSDVGGGYPMNTLSLVSLDWMMSKVEAKKREDDSVGEGLHFIQAAYAQINSQCDWHGMQHDSRSGLGAYYRYKPRIINRLCKDLHNSVSIRQPKLHRSVLERIKGNVVAYAPIGLPTKYEVVSSTDKPILPYETENGKNDRIVAMSDVMEIVGKRTLLYYLLVLTTMAFIATGFYPDPDCPSTLTYGAWFFDIVLGIFPDFTAPWIRTFQHHPLWLWSYIGLFSVLFYFKSTLWKQTQRHAMCAWKELKRRKEESGQ